MTSPHPVRAAASAVLRGLVGALLFLGPSQPAQADDGPAPDPRDRLLAARAARVDRNTAARHITPEGLLAYVHRMGATPAELSEDTAREWDTGIWTGAYAAAMACRWHVTRSPEALLLCQRLAAGLDLLSRATGVEGCLSRSVGRLPPGAEPGSGVVASPLGGNLHYRNDPSRDTLAGMTLGWWFLHKYVDDPEVRAYAARNLGAIARRLWAGKMQVRDPDGRITKYGALEAKTALVFQNGPYASIGLAAILAGKALSPCPELDVAWAKLREDGWPSAIDAQYTWLGGRITSATNMNMVHMALLVLATVGEPRVRENTERALRAFRDKSRGWQNGGYLAMELLSGTAPDRGDMVEELRQTLIDMPPGEQALNDGQRDGGVIVPIWMRPNDTWQWKIDSSQVPVTPMASVDPKRTFTRADWAFAYWLARAAGELDPGPEATSPR
jgi:hypothetical protein